MKFSAVPFCAFFVEMVLLDFLIALPKGEVNLEMFCMLVHCASLHFLLVKYVVII